MMDKVHCVSDMFYSHNTLQKVPQELKIIKIMCCHYFYKARGGIEEGRSWMRYLDFCKLRYLSRSLLPPL